MAASDTLTAAQKNELEVLKADLGNIKDDIKALADSYMGRAKNEARNARDSAQANFRSGLDQVEDYVEERPLTTVLVAFGIGLVLGKLFTN